MMIYLTDPTPLPAWLIVSLLRDVIMRLRGVLGFGDVAHRRAAMLGPFHAYLGRVLARFERLVRRHEAGLMRPPVARAKRVREDKPGKARVRLPMARAWVRGVVGWRSGGVCGQLETLLARPDMAGILALYPQAQAMFRPVCHMLGIAVASVPPLARRVRKPRPRPVRAKRLTRREREANVWYSNLEGKPMKLLPRRLPRD